MRSCLLLCTFLIVWISSCKETQEKKEESAPEIATLFPEKAQDMTIYEVNIRQYTPEGTINAFIKHLPRLDEMGVDILWIMPVQPISKKNRKGKLGSYYAIQHYTKVNEAYGDLEDFKHLVEEAHDRDMLVILDWVANHTGYDHPWTEKEGYYNTDSAGNIVSPNDDWTDVADLNYDNEQMRQDMIDAMSWWVENTNIDGFRCDMAGLVPSDFWSEAIKRLQKEKDRFMLAEW
ncbi:MAG: alpha-amylase family glycosyl hydrolase, partial [Fulvivirga sp.]|nr:alpha-amylase family glycosyl hydrolase [Fulvivirga sp.]